MALPEDVNNEEEENDFFDIAGDVLAAPFRGIEGAFQGAYNLADYLAFDVLPDYDTRFLGTSKTMAGGAVEGISQFATGFIPLFGLAGKAGRLAKAGTATKAVVAGAATDFTFFNGQEARLSNLIQQVPELQNPVTEFLAYDGEESELEGRMKNVLEGLGLEAVAGVFIKSLKAMKKARKVKEETGDAQKVADSITEDLAGEIAVPTRELVEEPEVKIEEPEAKPEAPKPLPEYKPNKQEEFLNAVPEKFRDYASELLKGGKPRLPQFALETDGDVVVLKDLLEKYYEANPEKVTVTDAVTDIDEAIETTVRAQAKEGEDAEKVLRDIRITQQAYREQGKALIQNVSEIAKEAVDNGYGDVSIAKLKNAFQQLLTVADVYRRIGRETAITLQARREDFGKRKLGLSEAETEIEGIRKEFVNNSGGMKPERMVKLVQEHIDPDDLEGSLARLLKTAKKAQGKHFLDMPTEYWMNSILSGPKTQMVNIMGNALTQVMTTLEAVAGGIASGNMDVVKAVIASWSDSEMFKEAAKFSKQAFKDQDNLLDPSNRAFEEGQRAAITGERLQQGPMGNLVSDSAKDSIDKYSQFIRLPSRLLLTSDEFFKQLAYRRAARLKAAMSGIQQGIRDPKALANHINKTVDTIVTEGGRMMSEEGLVREASVIADKKGLTGKDKADFIIDYKDKNFNPDFRSHAVCCRRSTVSYIY